MARCEVCEMTLFEGTPGIPCESAEQPTLWFCPEHYIEHVTEAHGGVPLPGATSLNAAKLYLLNRVTTTYSGR